ncbi:RecQ family ATP-dependent DNA helicase [Hoylesella timonensis]|uniref:ATP-dependent DNA helicase RecQ n=1 Tax=Hoylesella timonensis S9-PR14 TaxID=1401062 RepID=A0A098YLV5_9BACT|nr:ATP-dependent DNA helicase RecQ [Hoylesella timonensis]KGI20720.1 ATP-dependent DNA helicase RecQ [Hoylesella timonensis S9-PR14]
MPVHDKYLSILQQYWGYKDFRGIQREIIESIGQQRDTLGLMPTGGGKSITFQVPALAQPGICLVITPLIALMKDQVQHLKEKGITAAAIFSGMTRREILKTLDNCIFGDIKLLYISPERIGSELFLMKLRRMNVSFITVDEAHCISQWGYDFRPAYLNIADIRKEKPAAPLLALTATATPEVVEDIQQQLGFKEKNVFQMSFERSNLTYVVRTAQDKNQEILHILQSLPGCAIIYVRSRKRTKEVATLLNACDIPTTYYHAGLEHSVKDERQRAWQTDQIRVMVATNAFGMGIDKPDVRVVIHIDCPDSLEAYFQEAGRAGRDGQRSYAVLLYNTSDKHKLNKRIEDNFPEKDYIKDVYQHLAYYFEIGLGSGSGHTFTFDIGKFCAIFHYFPIPMNSALLILSRAGYIEYDTDPDSNARVMFLLDRNELYKLNQVSPLQEKVITSLLRTYGGLFTDYVYIDEALLAQQAGITREQLYLILKGLTQRRILHFIPQRKMPFITYAKDREAIENMVIPKAVYEERKEQFSKRIKSVIRYAENNEVCRSKQLLRYFGDVQAKDCLRCDVCLEQGLQQNSTITTNEIKQTILHGLEDKERHHITELDKLAFPEKLLDQVLEQLVAEEIIVLEGSYIYLANKG